MSDPSNIQRIAAKFHSNGGTFQVKMKSSNQEINADFGEIYVIQENSKIYYATTETWDSQPDYISQRGYIYIYSDWRTDGEGRTVAGIKIGDGETLLKNIPFDQQEVIEHMQDTVIHITQQEREFWNNKERSNVVNGTIIFTKN